MNTSKKFDEIMKEIVREENNAIMSAYEEKALKLEKKQECEIDERIVKAIIEYDKNKRYQRKKRYCSILSKIAIILIVCIVAVNFILPEPVEAFRTNVLGVFLNHNSGSVSIREELQADLLEDWDEFYYPEYVPNEYILLGAETAEQRSVMLFVSTDRSHKLEIEQLSVDGNISIDVDNTVIEKINVGYYEGIYAISESFNYSILTWSTENKLISICGDNSITKEEYIKIAESFEFVKR